MEAVHHSWRTAQRSLSVRRYHCSDRDDMQIVQASCKCHRYWLPPAVVSTVAAGPEPIPLGAGISADAAGQVG